MRNVFLYLLITGLMSISCSQDPTLATVPATEPPTSTPAKLTSLPTPYPTYTPYPTATAVPTPTAMPTATPMPTPEPTPTPTPVPTATLTPEPTPVPTATTMPTTTPKSQWVQRLTESNPYVYLYAYHPGSESVRLTVICMSFPDGRVSVITYVYWTMD